MYHKVILTSIIRRGGRESLDTNTLINQRQSRGLRQAAGESLSSARTTQRAGRERLGPTGGRQTESWVGSPPTTALSARRAELTSPTDRSPSWIRSFHKTISPLPPATYSWRTSGIYRRTRLLLSDTRLRLTHCVRPHRLPIIKLLLYRLSRQSFGNRVSQSDCYHFKQQHNEEVVLQWSRLANELEMYECGCFTTCITTE